MPRHVTLHPHLSTEELEQRYRQGQKPHERSWWQMLWLLSRGQMAWPERSMGGPEHRLLALLEWLFIPTSFSPRSYTSLSASWSHSTARIAWVRLLTWSLCRMFWTYL